MEKNNLASKDDKILQKLIAALAQLGLKNLTDATQRKFIIYIQLLLKWNRAYNLIGTDDPETILTEHILDSLSIAPYVKGQKIIDIGTGAGLPGIPLAIIFPDKQFVLLDSVGKKVRFLIQAIAELKLENVEAVQARAESYKSPQCFDHIVLRAFGTISDIIEKSQHLCCPNGSWLLMKGIYPEAELTGLTKKVMTYPLTVPGLNKARHLICIENSS